MQKKIFPIVALSLLSLNAYSLDSSGSGVMKLILPSTGSGVSGSAITKSGVINVKSQSFLVPGEILISARRQCGDGDVASFQAAHPTFLYNDGGSLKVKHVFGYWLTPEVATTTFPISNSLKSNQWVPIFYNELDISGAGSDYKSSSKSGEVPGGVVVAASPKNLGKVLKNRLELLFEKILAARHQDPSEPIKYRLQAASLICKDYVVNDPITSPFLTSHDIAFSFSGNGSVAKALEMDVLLLANPLNDNSDLTALASSLKLKEDVTKALNPSITIPNTAAFPLTVVKADGTIPLSFGSTDKFYQAASDVLSLLSWDLTDVNNVAFLAIYSNTSSTNQAKEDSYFTYTKNLNINLYNKLDALNVLIADTTKKCKDWKYDDHSVSDQNEDKHWYFPVPKMNLECKLLSSEYNSKLAGLFKLHTGSKTAFEAKRKDLAELLFKVAILQKAQAVANSQIANNEKISCFDSSTSTPYVNTILNGGALKSSYELDTTSSSGHLILKLSSPPPPIHHEYTYAISGSIQEAYATNNDKIIFSSANNGNGNGNGTFDINANLPIVNATSIGKIGIDLTVRSLHGSCVGQIVCLNKLLSPNDYK